MPYNIPSDINRAVVLVVRMDYESISSSPAMLASVPTAVGYSRLVVIELMLAQSIEDMGYRAVVCGNDVALSVPLVIDAGLGQYGRHGLLITPKYGSYVRIGTVLTDMPLGPDGPDMEFCESVIRFCEVCDKCDRHCPFQAIPYEREQTWEGVCRSNDPGVKKWYVDVEACHGYWLDNGTDCSNCNCIRSCPYNKPDAPAMRMLRHVILWSTKYVPALDRPVVALDDLFGSGWQIPPPLA